MMLLDIKQCRYFFCLLPFMMSPIVFTLTSNTFSSILLAFKMIAFIYIVVDYLFYRKLTSLDLVIFVYIGIWFVSTILNGESILDFLKEIAVIITFVFMIEDAFNKDEFYYVLNSLKYILFLEFTINLICSILYPEGMWSTTSQWGQEATYMFLGLGNQITPVFLIALAIFLIDFAQRNWHLSLFTIVYGIVLCFNLYYIDSATAVVGAAVSVLCLAILLFRDNPVIRKIFLTLIFLVAIGIVFFGAQSYFSFIIETILQKDLTLTSRTTIWQRAITTFLDNPVLGYGCETLATIIVDRNAHCFYLQILLQSGIIGFSQLVVVFFTASRKFLNNTTNDNFSIIIFSCLCGLLVCNITEVYSQGWFFLFICLLYSYCSILEGKKDENVVSENLV